MTIDIRTAATVFDLNDRAVTCLQNNDPLVAFGLLQQALSTLSLVSPHRRVESLSSGAGQHGNNNDYFVEPVVLDAQEVNSPYDHDQNIFVFYDRAFIPMTYSGCCGTTRIDGRGMTMDHRKITAVVLYNLALTGHIMGMNGNLSCREDSFNMALKLYRAAYRIIDDDDDASSGGISRRVETADAPSKLLQLAASNNIGHIHAHYFDMSKVEECIRRMIDIIDKTTTDVREDFQDDYKHFHGNMLLLSGQLAPASPAA